MGMTARLLLTLIALASIGCSRERWRFEKHEVGRLPHTSTRETYYTLSADGTHLAVIHQTPDGQRVVEGDTIGDPYARIAQVHYAGDSNVLFYYGLDDDPAGSGPLTLVAGGRTFTTSAIRRGILATSPDGAHWALVGREREPDGDRPARVVIIMDDGTMHRWADTTVPTFTRDGKHLLYVAEDAEGAFHLVEDGAIRRTFEKPAGKCAPLVKPTSDNTPTLSPVFGTAQLPTGEPIVFVQDRDCWSIWLGDQRLGSYTAIAPGRQFDMVIISPEFAHDAKMLVDPIAVATTVPRAFWWERLAGITDSWHIVANGQPVGDRTCTRAWDQGPIRVSDDGAHLLYPCYQPAPEGSRFDDIMVVHDATAHGPFKFVFGFAMSADGHHAAWAAAAEGEDAEWYFHWDGRQLEPGYENVHPSVFSANGEHVAWTGRRNDRAWLVLDGRPIAHVDEVVRAPKVHDDGGITAVVRRERRLTRLVLRRETVRWFF